MELLDNRHKFISTLIKNLVTLNDALTAVKAIFLANFLLRAFDYHLLPVFVPASHITTKM